MQHISDSLAKVDRQLTRHANTMRILNQILKDEINLELKKGEVKIRGSTLVVRANPTIKMEILLRREKILALLNKALGPGVIGSVQ